MSKLLRVRQYDAIILDEEILKLLKSGLDNTARYLPSGLTVPYQPEIDLAVNLLVLFHSVWKNDCTFGQQLLLIKYENLSHFKKILYIILSCSPYLKERLALWKPSHGINRIFDYIEAFYKIFHFINLCKFLRTGQMPRVIDRLLGLSQIHTVKIRPREINNKYLTRELLWNGLIELLMFVLPLINIYKIKRIIRNINPFYNKIKSSVSLAMSKRTYTFRTKCPHCNESPIKPYHMGCEHIFCYMCLKSNLLADEKYECPLCGYSSGICEKFLIL